MAPVKKWVHIWLNPVINQFFVYLLVYFYCDNIFYVILSLVSFPLMSLPAALCPTPSLILCFLSIEQPPTAPAGKKSSLCDLFDAS